MSAITSNEVTYENEGISETLTNTIDTLYRELKEYRTNGSVTSNEMLEGYTGYAKGKLVSGSIPSKKSTTYTPGVNNQVITKGQYLSEEQVILGDANLVSENIKEGVEIFGIKGSIKDNSGKTLEATNIASDDEFTYLSIPEGIYNNESKIKINSIFNNVKDIYNNGKILVGGSLAVSGSELNAVIKDKYLRLFTLTTEPRFSTIYFTEPINLSSYNAIVIKQETSLNGNATSATFDIGTTQNSNNLLSFNINNKMSGVRIVDLSSISKEKLNNCYFRFSITVTSGDSRIYDIYRVMAFKI